MQIIKRSGKEAAFDKQKIVRAISSANNEVEERFRIPEERILSAADMVEKKCERLGRAVNVEEVQELVETQLMIEHAYDVAKKYIRYRYDRNMRRGRNTTDETILSLVDYKNEEVKQENSNKNPEIIPTQRDYIAGEISRDLTRRALLPHDIVEAHDEGIIHFHDADYFIQRSHNCDLVNLEDMLQNGTVISGTMIEKPHLFSTACNIATQIIAQVASSQYGGQSISLAHLAPFVDVSRSRFNEQYAYLKSSMPPHKYAAFIESMVLDDIKRGVQTIQYQVVTLMTTNGQAPFITVYMNINEPKDRKTQSDLAIVIKEVLEQRIEGVKNEKGVWITPAFPKLIYVLDENNIYPGTEYFYLTELAAKCTAKRMVPDYISAKIMRELKGDVYTCMGCRSFLTPDTVGMNPDGSHKYYGRLTIH